MLTLKRTALDKLHDSSSETDVSRVHIQTSDGEIIIYVAEANSGSAKLRFDAPKSCLISRGELVARE